MPHQLSLFLLITSAPAVAYNIQSTVTSVFSLLVSTTILNLTILELILWTTNLRKQMHKNLKHDTY
jgi:hypothetical protein